jgi:2-alkyl-3-oxoalkanoate reductase
MRILVTGACGFLGTELIEAIHRLDAHSIIAVVREGTDVSKIKPLVSQILFEDLVRPQNLLESLKNVDLIYHVAAATSGSHTDLILNTVVGTENLLEAIARAQSVQRLVLVSTFSVYALSGVSRYSVVNEKTPTESKPMLRDPYTISKVRQERLAIRHCREMNLPLVIVRPGKIYHPKQDALPPQLGLRLPGIGFICIGSNGQIPLAHVSSCAEAVYRAGVVRDIGAGVINVVDDDLPSKRRYLKEYEARFGRLPRRFWIPYPVFVPMAWFFEKLSARTKGNVPPIITRYRAANLWKPFYYDNTLAKTILNWRPRPRWG